MNTVILIPAYQPDHRLIDLVAAIVAAGRGLAIVLVDDGSGPAYAPVFARAEAMGALVLRHAVNRGKGAALKTGFAHIAADHPSADVVCADCDGQHRPADILKVAGRLTHSAAVLVLGARAFAGGVPLRSRIGNGVTRGVFLLATGRHLSDTQTGLRGYPASMLAWLRGVRGERFEYELELLLQAVPAGYAVEEVEIETVYLEGNASSHFRPVADSLRVYRPLLAFGASSLGAFLTDTIGLFVLMALTGNLLASVVGARVVSAGVNYLTNQRFVFSRTTPSARPGGLPPATPPSWQACCWPTIR